MSGPTQAVTQKTSPATLWCIFLNHQLAAIAGFLMGVVFLNYIASGTASFHMEYPTSYVAMYVGSLVGLTFTSASLARRKEWPAALLLTLALVGGITFVIVWLRQLWW